MELSTIVVHDKLIDLRCEFYLIFRFSIAVTICATLSKDIVAGLGVSYLTIGQVTILSGLMLRSFCSQATVWCYHSIHSIVVTIDVSGHPRLRDTLKARDILCLIATRLG